MAAASGPRAAPAPLRWLGQRLSRPYLLLLAPSFLHDAEDRGRCLITDGGHSENLGVWPLLLRRCKLILVSDAGQDSDHIFDDFLKVCRRVRLYHGVHIVDLYGDRPLDLEPLQLRTDLTCQYHFFIGRIRYPGDFMRKGGDPNEIEEGFIIYLKPSLTNDEENDLLRHFRHRRPFPHDPTVNQLFDEDTVESYRQLGHHIGETLCSQLPDNLWQEDRRHDVATLFWEYLRRNPRVEAAHEKAAPARPDSEGGRDALRAMQRFNVDAEHRTALAEEVRTLLAKHQRRGVWHGEPMQLSAALLAEWAVTCHNRVLNQHPPMPTTFRPIGRERLLELALTGARELVKAGTVDEFVEHASNLAIALAADVFPDAGAETARAFILCLLTAHRFRAVDGFDQRTLLDYLEAGNGPALAHWLRNTHRQMT